MKKEDELRSITTKLAMQFMRGEPDLYIVKEYRKNRVEVLHFGVLVAKDIFTSFIIEANDTIKKLFPPESLVWISQERKLCKFTEATCNDKQAKQEYEIAKKKMRKDVKQRTESTFIDGQMRTRYIN